MQVKDALKGHERLCKGFGPPGIGKERFENCKPCQRLRKSLSYLWGSGIKVQRRLLYCLNSQLEAINYVRCATCTNPRMGFLPSDFIENFRIVVSPGRHDRMQSVHVCTGKKLR